MSMATARKVWTLEEVHSLPDDGNKYELVWGELFVTPPPTDEHETITARLTRLIDPYVAANALGLVYRPRAVFRLKGSEVEPDLMVRQPHPRPTREWDAAPKPSLIVEVLSPSTRRRDHVQKRNFYMESGIAEYWMLDPESRTLTMVRPDEPDRVEHDLVTWQPLGDRPPLVFRLADVFG